MLQVKEMYLFKKSKKTGTFSIKFADDRGNNLFINEIKLDMDNTIEPVSFYAIEGRQLISGGFFEILKSKLPKFFKEAINGDETGLFKYSGGKLEKV